jgi:predicted glycosyltransferase
MRRVAFLVTHLTGAGHLARTLAIARAVAAAGGAATVISGGRPTAGIDAGGVRLVQLPAVAVADLDYTRLTDAAGRHADAALMAARGRAIADALAETAPHALATELWPFGRRLLRAEFAAAAAQARAAGAAVWCSVRDLPETPKRPERVAETEATLRAGFAGALVHGDGRLAPLGLSWPGADRIADLTVETGYVAEPLPAPAGDPDEVLVATGTGALGRPLLETAVAAARRGDRPWRLRVGGADAAAVIAALRAAARGAPVTVEPVAADYRARLRTCAASVSLFGYNTAVDLLQTGAPAVVAPFTTPVEHEQGVRARAFARLAQIEVAEPATLTPAGLAAAVARAVDRGRTGPAAVDLAGAETAARLLLQE